MQRELPEKFIHQDSLKELIEVVTELHDLRVPSKPGSEFEYLCYGSFFPMQDVEDIYSNLKKLEKNLKDINTYLFRHNIDEFIEKLDPSSLKTRTDIQKYIDCIYSIKLKCEYANKVFMEYKKGLLAEIQKERENQNLEKKTIDSHLKLLHQSNLKDYALAGLTNTTNNKNQISRFCRRQLYNLIKQMDQILEILVQTVVVKKILQEEKQDKRGFLYSDLAVIKSNIEMITVCIAAYLVADTNALKKANEYGLKSKYNMMKKIFSNYQQTLGDLEKLTSHEQKLDSLLQTLDSTHKIIFDSSCKLGLIDSTTFPLSTDKLDEKLNSIEEDDERIKRLFYVYFSLKDDSPSFKIDDNPFVHYDKYPDYFAHIISFYKELSLNDKLRFLKLFIPEAIEKYDGLLLLELVKMVKIANDGIFNGYTEHKQEVMVKLSEIDQIFMEKLFSLDQLTSPFKNDLILEFLKRGKITEKGGLLTLAQIANRKKNYSFTPTIINSIEDFHEYLKIIQQTKTRPLDEIFIISNGHWRAGIIEIDKSGQEKLLLVDSEGKNIFNQTYIMIFAKVFPGGKIYHNEEVRHNRYLGCSVFALSDARYLSLAKERYIINNDLFSFVEAQKIKTSSFNDYKFDKDKKVNLTFSRLPLVFYRIMESRKLGPLIEERTPEERVLNIKYKENKGVKTAKECFQSDFKLVNGKLQNQRTHHLLKKMFIHNFDYLKNMSDDEKLKESMQVFSLDGFRVRIKAKEETELNQNEEPLKRNILG